MTIVNCTPHPLGLLVGGQERAIAPSGILPRAEQISAPAGAVNHDGLEIPIETLAYGEVTGLPEEADGVFHVVSLVTAQAAPHRKDLLVPSRQVRDEQGRIVGCAALGRLTR